MPQVSRAIELANDIRRSPRLAEAYAELAQKCDSLEYELRRVKDVAKQLRRKLRKPR